MKENFDRDNSESLRPKIWVSWSSGKDSYAVLREIWDENLYEVDCMFTTVDTSRNQIPMHAIY
jgi:3'-phosphoadenosine 5'-phosphosulfate sulfotransferase (PAPS reductase)/FAD synthetase